MQQVFLGGVESSRDWRKHFTEMLLARGVPEEQIFNPQSVSDSEKLLAAKESACYLFYVGACDGEISIEAAIQAVLVLQEQFARAVLVFDATDCRESSTESMKAGLKLLQRKFPSRAIFDKLEDAADFLARHFKPKAHITEVKQQLLDKLRYSLSDEYTVGIAVSDDSRQRIIVYGTQSQKPSTEELSKIPKQYEGYSVEFKWIGVVQPC